MTAVLDAALGYAAASWPVIPLWWPLGPGRCACGDVDCRSAGKHPHGRLAPHGLEDASCDPDVIGRWWTAVPDLNVGLRTGISFDVLDLDNVDAGQWLARHAHELGEDTSECWGWGPLSITAHGHHLLYAPTGAGNRTAVRGVKGFDWRGRDGYIVAPPSRHESGHVYVWQLDCAPDAPIPPAPDFLGDLVTRRHRPAEQDETTPSRATPSRANPSGRWSSAGLVAKVATAAEGQRNSVLNWAAHRVGIALRDRLVSAEQAYAALDDLALAAERAGLTAAEIDATVNSGFHSSAGGPR